MCGIVGYIGEREASEVVLDGLKRLEYRGYDSAGVVIAGENGAQERHPPLSFLKRAGKLDVLRQALDAGPISGRRGMGHTRWATHGRPTDVNAHPHLSEDGALAVIHNGIIENYLPLKELLLREGHVFLSDTDTEVLVHLIERAYHGDLVQAVRDALGEVTGAYALVVTHADHEQIVAARATSPMVVGLGDGEQWVASDVPALLPYTRRVVFLHDGDLAVLERGGVEVTDFEGGHVERPEQTIDWDAEAAEKGGFEHFMLKEIHEQPTVLQQTLGGRFDGNGRDVLLDLTLDPTSIDRVVVVAAGTAAYAGAVGEYLIETLARLPSRVEVASEFRYRDPVVDERTLVIAVSQSGETIDTLEAVREARRRGARTLAILNVKGSSMSREVDDILYVHAGPEISVASTKVYVAMLAAFGLLAVWLGRGRGTLDDARAEAFVRGLRGLPQAVDAALTTRERVKEVAQRYAHARDYLFFGRGVNVPTAFEGALKLKEISYIHAEAYATGEMKHGPIALVDENLPIVAIATASALYDKTISSLQEVRARDGIVIALASEGDETIHAHADVVLIVPRVDELLSPVVNVIPLQLLAYETALALGRDVDQPRNLAKSVTVE
ncbi:MAG: glutamine--fructose-6-phosphate transaminase (isomerizing) [Trueperaceae bacterium]|nr:glutamine--fructose-6-phosphate transaminase (isomerizing) [Trueperaceae bacterium]